MLDQLLLTLMKLKDTWTFSVKDKIFFFRELSYLLEWGVSLLESTNLIKSNTENYMIKSICEQMYNSLVKWETLHRSMSRMPKFFNEWDVNIIKSWETSWELQNVLTYLANEYENLYDIKNRYIGALIYPSIILLVSVWAVYIILKFVLPGIFSIIDQFNNVQLPFATRVLISAADFISAYGTNFLIILFFLVFALSLVLSTEEGKKYFDVKIFQIPVFGKLSRYYSLVKFLRYMKLLINSGMNFVEVFTSLRFIMDNRLYKEMCDEIVAAIRRWEPVVSVMQNYQIIIPSDVTVLLKVGEETASFGSSTERAIWFYEQEFNKMVNNFSKVVEPIMIVVVWVIIAFIALSVFGVIWSILDSMQI